MTQRHRDLPRFAAVTLVLLFLCGSLFASQDPEPSESDEVRQSEQPQVLTRRDSVTVSASSVNTAAAAQSVIERARIDTLDTPSVAELVRAVPGVFILSNGTAGGLSAIQIRGADPNFTLVALDGLPLNDATDQLGGVYNLEGLYAGHLERIEVVRGPLSTFFGSQALGGVVNLTTRRGESDHPRLEAELEAGDARFLRASSSLSGRGQAGDYFLGAAWRQEDGRVADDRFEARNLVANLGRRLGDKGTFRFVSRLSSWEADDYPDASGGPLFGSGATRFSDNLEFSASTQFNLDGGRSGRHNFAFHFYRHHLNRNSPGVFPQVPPSLESTRLNRFRGAWTADIRVGDAIHLQTGADLEVEEADNRSQLTLPADLGGAVRGDYSSRRRSLGGYAGILGEKGRFLYEAGLRADLLENSETELSPRLALSRAIGPNTRARATVARSFKLPSFFALSSPRQLGGNAALRPESVWGGDLGLDHRFVATRLTLSSSFFYNRYRNLVDFDFDLFLHVNRNQVRTRGVELETDWEINDQWRVAGWLTWLGVRDLEGDRPLLQRPSVTGGASVVWRPRSNLELFVEGWAVSSRFDRQIPVPELSQVAGYGLVNLAAKWSLSEYLSLRARIDNLTGVEYQTLIGFPGAGRAFRVSLALHNR